MAHPWVDPYEGTIEFEDTSQNDWLSLGTTAVNIEVGGVEGHDFNRVSNAQKSVELLVEDRPSDDSSSLIYYGAVSLFKHVDIKWSRPTENLQVCGVQIRVRKRQNTPLAALVETRKVKVDSNFAILQCRLNKYSCSVVAETGQAVADTNNKTFKALTACSNISPLRYEAVIPIETMHTMADCADHEKLFTIDLNIRGPPDEADRVAASLCDEGMFLQDPLWLQDAIPYMNPQQLDFPTLSADDYCALPMTIPDDNDKLQPAEIVPNNDVVNDFQQILDDFSHKNCFEDEIEVPQIRTGLLSHQIEGFKFIVQKESKASLSSFDLWRESETADGQHCFQHIITKSRSPKSSRTTGGIIADDMGLGKTLTMLTAIIGLRQAAADEAYQSYSPEKIPIAAMSTLVVVPSALLMDSWTEEIEKHMLINSLSYHKFHGSGKEIKIFKLLQNDIVLTTYGTLATIYRRENSLLHQIKWYRVVLDEAHTIRNSSTKQFEAVKELHSLHRWCLSGTPIQNSLEDLGALVRFLRVPILEDPIQFRRHIVNKTPLNRPIHDKEFANLKALLGSICLRRNKSLLPIAEPGSETYDLEFSADEESEYKHIMTVGQETLDLAVSGHKGKEAHQSVLEMLLRLRLFCNNGSRFRAPIHPSTGLSTDPEEALSFLETTGQAVCHHCGSEVSSLRAPDDPDSAFLTVCRRVICSGCLTQDRVASDGSCITCRGQHALDPATRSSDIFDELRFSKAVYPTKLLALCEDIQTKRIHGKSVVFSFWKKSLDIVDYLLRSRGINIVRIDGSVSLRKRTAILGEFQRSPGGIVLLMTLGTGSEGLNNLSTADTVHILEPQWNPSVEKQAIGRVVRLGQTKKVTIVRYIMNKTIEGMIQGRQQWKLELVQNSFGNKNSKEAKQKTAEICKLIFTGFKT